MTETRVVSMRRIQPRAGGLRAGGLPSTSQADVLVTGADEAGLVLGIDLARHRANAVLVDARAPESAAGARSSEDVGSTAAVALDVESQELLEDLGVLDRLIAAARAGRALSVMSDVEQLVVPRRVLLSVLGDRLIELGGRVHRGHEYAGCERDGTRLDTYFSGPDGPIMVRAHALVRTDVPDSGVEGVRRFTVGAAGSARGAVGATGLAGGAVDVNRRLQDAYNLGWKLSAVIGGAPEWIVQTYQVERIAGHVSSLTLPDTRPRPQGCAIPGERAPDAPLLSASGAATRVSALTRGPHWTLLGYGLEPAALAAADFAARAGLRVHAVGAGGAAGTSGTCGAGAAGDVVDIEGELQWAYGLSTGDRMLIRPDGVLAAVVGAAELAVLRAHLAAVGLRGG
jgi:hypothetical protein